MTTIHLQRILIHLRPCGNKHNNHYLMDDASSSTVSLLLLIRYVLVRYVMIQCCITIIPYDTFSYCMYDRFRIDVISCDDYMCREYLESTLLGKFFTYYTHRLRAQYEETTLQRLIEELKPGQCLLVTDWKMKLLAISFRESRTEYFAKRGIPWFGVMVIRKRLTAADTSGHHDTTSSSSSSKSSKIATFDLDFESVVEFYDNLLTRESAEDAFAVCSMLQGVLTELHLQNPDITTEAFLYSDSAGCFTGFELWVFLSQLGNLTGIRILRHYLSEAGGGKTALDCHFSFCLKTIIIRVAEGCGTCDIYCSQSANARKRYC